MKTKQSYVKNVWSCQEDTILSEAVHGIGPSKWSVIASLLEGRTAKQCRERWHNHLNVGIRKGEWSEEDDLILLRSQATLGNQWSKIAKCLDGRSDTDTKNRFFVLQRAKKRSEQCKIAEKYKIKIPIHHDTTETDQSSSLHYCNKINKKCSSNENSLKVSDNGKCNNSNLSSGNTSNQNQFSQSKSNTISLHSTSSSSSSSHDSINRKSNTTCDRDEDKDLDNNSDTSSEKSDSSIPSDIGLITSTLCKYLANRLS